MIEFDDKEIQRAFDECHFRQEFDGTDICGGMCKPCGMAIKSGECSMLAEHFSKKMGGRE